MKILNYEGIAWWRLQFYHFSDSDRLRVGSVRMHGFEWLAVMVISQPPGNNPSYYYRATNAASIALNASRDTLCSMHYNYNIRVTHRNGAIKHIFTWESDPRRSHQQIISLFILSLHALAHLAVKILLQIFLSSCGIVSPHTSLSVVFPSE